ncbi:anthranilate phosphoribosyltransferase [Aminipila sp.]|uniref:anthranilate phosphoribosyltransferase n=1 Tax=Aminipila sp. TaxID=2060095 RepID=UPI001DF01823|nr:anthranilate phosphoribosyltransferase [Aminipila sp.]MBE6034216.1 anthranilate phosphoribosyltransferase [Clostridiales bacterium]
MIKEAIKQLVNKENLEYETAERVMDEIMSGKASDIQKSAYLAAMSLKGETIEEITASVEGMRKHCISFPLEMNTLEIVGTGGDGSDSFNISTTSSFVISAAGVPVAKHGNRAASSKCGAADVLEALGININVAPEKSAAILKEIGICFLFAQRYHTAMKHVAPVRKELGIRTMFNILGPLSNPAKPKMQLMGVYDKKLTEPLAKVLLNLGVNKAMVVYGNDGLDEISMSDATTVCEIKDGKIISYEMAPENFGLKRCRKNDLIGGTPLENAEITKRLLQGERNAKRDAVVLNSAAALYIAGKAASIREGIDLAEQAIDTGTAIKQLDRFIELSNS